MPGILIISRAYKIHTVIFFNDSYWTTMSKTNLTKISVFLLYRGNLNFEDTRLMTTQEYADRKQYFIKLHKYFEEAEVEDALDCLCERAKKEKQRKPVIESDIEELSSKSADIMLTGEEESEQEESQESDSGYHETNNNLPVPCSVCSRKKHFAQALNCDKCSKGTASALPAIGSSDDLDLENALHEAVENDIMPNEDDKNQAKELNVTVNANKVKADIMPTKDEATEETENKVNIIEGKKDVKIVLKDIMLKPEKSSADIKPIRKSKRLKKSQSSSGSSSSGSESSSGSSEPPPSLPAKKCKLSQIGMRIRDLQPNCHGCYVCPKTKCHKDYPQKELCIGTSRTTIQVIKDFIVQKHLKMAPNVMQTIHLSNSWTSIFVASIVMDS